MTSRSPLIRFIAAHRAESVAIAIAVLYLAAICVESPSGFLQVTLNGVGIGAIYALVALGFTLVYGTVWFFDLSYGAMAAFGGYTVFYLAGSQVQNIGRGAIDSPVLNVFFGLLVVGVVAWTLHASAYPRLRRRFGRRAVLGVGGLLALVAGGYVTVVLGAERAAIHVYASPLVAMIAALVFGTVWFRLRDPVRGVTRPQWWSPVGVLGALVAGALVGLTVARTSGTNLYVTWLIGPLLAGAMGLALYRGVYVYILSGARSSLGVLVGSLGILLALTAFTSVIFSPAGKTLPSTFGSPSWEIGGAYIKPFNLFVIVLVLVLFLGVTLLLKKTNFGKAVRAISDDAEVARIVGVNTTVVIAVVFFLGAAVAALGGLLFGHDNAIRPNYGFMLLLKAWVASVVGGIGNIHGALLGGFVLGLVENYGIWYLDAEWKNAIAFLLLLAFLVFWPNGLLPRK